MFFASYSSPPTATLFGRGDPPLALQPGHLVLAEQELDALHVGGDHLALARQHPAEVEPDIAVHQHAVVGELVPRLLVMLAGLQQRLGRDAADVEAGAAERRPLLHAAHLHAELGGADGADIAARAGADHDEVETLGHGASGSICCGGKGEAAPNLGPEAARGKCRGRNHRSPSAGGAAPPQWRQHREETTPCAHPPAPTRRPPRRAWRWARQRGRPRRAGARPGQVPGPPDPPDHPLAARRLGRRAAPLARRTRRPQARRDDRGGEPHRRVRHPRRPVPDHPGAPGRLHHQPDAPLDHPAALSSSARRPGTRWRTSPTSSA